MIGSGVPTRLGHAELPGGHANDKWCPFDSLSPRDGPRAAGRVPFRYDFFCSPARFCCGRDVWPTHGFDGTSVWRRRSADRIIPSTVRTGPTPVTVLSLTDPTSSLFLLASASKDVDDAGGMNFLLYLALIPASAVAAQWLAWRTKLPGILLLLLVGIGLGMFVRPDAYIADLIGGERTAIPAILFPLVSLSVAVIMFEGGLSLKVSELRESGDAALRLCTVGAALTFVGVALAAGFVLGFGVPEACLLGAVLVVTGPTVIGPLLRQIRPSRRVANTLKWEGIVIDPIGAILAVLVFDQISAHGGEGGLAVGTLMLLKTVGIGTGLGLAAGWLLATAMRRFWIPDQLQGVASLAVALLAFAIANTFAHESGLITVTVMGIWLINWADTDVEHVVEFQENLRTLLLGCLFIVLGSRVQLGDAVPLLLPAFLFVVALVLLVRPISVFVSLLGSSLDWREKVFVSSMAPRGIVAAAVSSIFALELEALGGDSAEAARQLSTITFLTIVGTVTVYGLAAQPIARWLKLADERSDGVLIVGADPWVRAFALGLKNAGVPTMVVDTNYAKVSRAKLEGLDAACVNMLNEHAREGLETSGIGRLLAMTVNDEVNTLIIKETRTQFERADAYQLPFDPSKLKGGRGLDKQIMGRVLFADDATHTELRQTFEVGGAFKQTKLSEEFTYDDFCEKYQHSIRLLAVLDEDGELIIVSPDVEVEPAPGQTVIAQVLSVAIPEDHAARDGAGRAETAKGGTGSEAVGAAG